MKTILKNLERTMYGGLENYPKTLLLINSLLKNSKIKEVREMYERSLNGDDLFEEDLTLISNPSIQGRYTNINTDSNLRSSLISNGFGSVRDGHNKPEIKCEDIKIDIKIDGVVKNVVIGYYFRERNAIIIPFNLFKYDWSNDTKYFLEIFNKLLESLDKLKPKKVNVKEAIENVKIEKFLVTLKNNLSTLSNNKNTYTQDLENYNQSILSRMSDIESVSAQIEALQGLLKNKSEIITTKLKEIRELPFTKNVKLTKEGIMVDIGLVHLNYDKVRTELGRYRIYIKSDKIKIYNLDAIKRGSGNWYDHPHVKDTSPCLGSWNKKINNMLHALELKNLVLSIKLYLQSYNPESPFINWREWCEERKKQPIRKKGELPSGENPAENREYTNKLRDEDKTKFGKFKEE